MAIWPNLNSASGGHNFWYSTNKSVSLSMIRLHKAVPASALTSMCSDYNIVQTNHCTSYKLTGKKANE